MQLVVWTFKLIGACDLELTDFALTVMLRVYILCPRAYRLEPIADSSESKAHSLELIAYSLCPWILELGFLDQVILNF